MGATRRHVMVHEKLAFALLLTCLTSRAHQTVDLCRGAGGIGSHLVRPGRSRIAWIWGPDQLGANTYTGCEVRPSRSDS